MNFLRLHDSLLTVLFEDDDIIAIDKPYGFNAHTNDSKIEHSEFIQDGLIETYEKNRGGKLHIIHRLDQTTTGVMIFGKSVESAKKYAEFFFHRQVKKTYLFITKNKSTAPSFLMDQQIIHKGRELEAKTQLSFLKKSGLYELWQANPYTGRNHQIRIHAKAAGISILGDPKYEGAPYSFLCLHNHKIEFPNGISIASKPPAYYEDLRLLEDVILAKAFFEIDRRQRLYSFHGDPDQCYRLVHNRNNATEPGFTLDRFGQKLVTIWYKEHWNDNDLGRFKEIAKFVGLPMMIRFVAEKAAPPRPTIFIGTEPGEWLAKEGAAQYELRTDATASVGLFLNQRLQRRWVLDHTKDKSVLNLFAYTGGFSVAAALGQARQVTTVEAGKNPLNWARKNFELNKIDSAPHLFFCRDSFTFLEQALSKNTKYDLIVSDTPSFMKREKKLFKIKTDLEPWIQLCLKCLKPGGEFLFSTSFDGFFIADLQKILLQAQKNLKIPKMEISCLLPSMDFELPEEKTNLKSFLIRI